MDTQPDGGSLKGVFDAALAEQIAVLPGTHFYVDGGRDNTLRLNFSNSTEQKIITGIDRLPRVIKKWCGILPFFIGISPLFLLGIKTGLINPRCTYIVPERVYVAFIKRILLSNAA